ncbi:hypothetical protein Tco_1422088 [Tanacetum coccineum]
MASNIKNFKCLIHFNETQRGSILSEDLTYSMLHEMAMKKFNMEANAVINLSFKLSSFDTAVDITDDAEETDIQQKDKKSSKNGQNRARNEERGKSQKSTKVKVKVNPDKAEAETKKYLMGPPVPI